MAERASPRLAHVARDRRGNVALIVALLLPALLIVSLGAVELNQVLSDQRTTQNVADSAALMGAAQLSVTPNGADKRAQTFATAQLAGVARYAAISAAATINADNSMTVAIDTHRASFFGSLFPPGGFHTHVASTAKGVNTVPLCVLGLAPVLTDLVQVTGTSQLQAGACLVHANQELIADPTASILASANEAGTVAVGPITAAANLLAPNIADPFASVNVAPPVACSGSLTALSYTGSTPVTIPAGMHGSLSVSGTVAATLQTGAHYFCGNVQVGGNATLTGNDVVLVFDGSAQLQSSGSGAISLAGRTVGALAGFVIVADRSVTSPFPLPSDHFSQLTGTVYVPNAPLVVTGTGVAGATTPWTVIVAKSFQVTGGAQLIINANYAGSGVPVPIGVGPTRKNVKLVQ